MRNKSTIGIYYWSKLDIDEKLAGGDIRAKYLIPELIDNSETSALIITPDMIFKKRFVQKHKTLAKILITAYLPIYITKVANKHKSKLIFIYCSTCYTWDLLPQMFLKLFFKSKLICVSHDTPKQLEGYSFFRRNEKFSIFRSAMFTIISKLQMFLIRYIDLPIAISNFAEKFFPEGKVRERVFISSNGVPETLDVGNIGEVRMFDIVTLGRIIPRKNNYRLFRALTDLKTKDKLKILVITNSSLDVVKKEIISNLDESSVSLTLMRDVSERTKFELLKNSKVYVSLSEDENFSVATVEAASMGAALILSNNDFYRDIYGDSAMYVHNENYREIQETIINLLSDDHLLRHYQAAAIEVAQNYLYSDIGRKEQERIESILEN